MVNYWIVVFLPLFQLKLVNEQISVRQTDIQPFGQKRNVQKIQGKKHVAENISAGLYCLKEWNKR